MGIILYIEICYFWLSQHYAWGTPSCCCTWLRSIYFHCCVVFHCINQLQLNQEFIYAFSCRWTFAWFPSFSYNVQCCYKCPSQCRCTRASFSRRSQSRSGITSSESARLNFTGAAKLLCRTAAAIYIPTGKVLTRLTPDSCQHLVLSDFKCLPCWWVCEVFTVICASPLTTVTLRVFSYVFVLLCFAVVLVLLCFGIWISSSVRCPYMHFAHFSTWWIVMWASFPGLWLWCYWPVT